MKILLRWCPECKKETIQVRLKRSFFDVFWVIWYCPHCAQYNKDGNPINNIVKAG